MKKNGITTPKKLSKELEAVIGKGPMTRGEVMKKIWVYIKNNDLQNPDNGREILIKEKLKIVFPSKKKISMFDLAKLLSDHIS